MKLQEFFDEVLPHVGETDFDGFLLVLVRNHQPPISMGTLNAEDREMLLQGLATSRICPLEPGDLAGKRVN